MDIAALKAISGRLQQRALARLSLKSPPNRIAREDAALDQEAATSILSMIARLEALEALHEAVAGQMKAGLGGRLLPSVVAALSQLEPTP